MTDIVILDGARTAIGTFGGALASTAPIDLATVVTEAALERSGVEGGQIGHVVFGNVISTEPRDMYLSRVAAMQAGIPNETPAMNVNRLCGSGAQADCIGGPVADAGGCRIRGCRRGRKHVAQPLYRAAGALGCKDGRCNLDGYDAGSAELSVRNRAHGGDS